MVVKKQKQTNNTVEREGGSDVEEIKSTTDKSL